MRHVVAASTERDYLGHFGAWVDFRARSRVSGFLDRGIGVKTNACHLFQYVAHALATKKLLSATTESHPSAIEFFHRISSRSELDTTHLVIASALKDAARSHAEVGNQATVRRPVSWAMLLAGETLILLGGTGGACCGLRCVRRFIF